MRSTFTTNVSAHKAALLAVRLDNAAQISADYSSCLTDTRCPLISDSPFLLPTPATTIPLWFYDFDNARYILYMESRASYDLACFLRTSEAECLMFQGNLSFPAVPNAGTVASIHTKHLKL